MVIDRKTNKEVNVGDVFSRRGGRGIVYDYEILDILAPHTIVVNKYLKDSFIRKLSAPLISLQLDYVVSKDT